MKIAVGGSMQFAEQMLKIKVELTKLGHEVFLSMRTEAFAGKSDEEKEQLKLQQKYHENAMNDFWQKMKAADALLILNYDKHGIPNYIGGNSLMDIAIAHFLGQKIFLLNSIPDIAYYKTEIEAIKPIVLNGDLSSIG